ncbi:Plant disease resistance response protein [Corchorus olitorius]|uniref:Dirigent protein n=1 Tax=Corchorus olitorius TaxID=93759 RepID=A0A1R3JDC2_9ROSI|nr:Plant disease resistance response protein [Corchorus olitorius]
MGRTLMFAWILVLCLSVAQVHSKNYYSQILPYVPKTVTNLHFYIHETLSGQNATALTVVRPNTTADNSSIPFGSIGVLDDILKVGPEPDSEVIGNARGLAASASKDGSTLVVYLDFGFTKGMFNGSSFSVFSRNPVMDTERELAVVGGRGKLRMAQGFALIKTVFINATNLVVEYNVTVFHY